MFWALSQDPGSNLRNPRTLAALKPLFRECAEKHALTIRNLRKADVDTLETRDQYMLLGCVVETIANDKYRKNTQVLLAIVVEDYPVLGEPGTAAYLLPALYRSVSYEAAEFLLSHTAANTTADFNPSDEPRFKGLSLAQYHAYYRRLDIAELFISHGVSIAPGVSRFRHWIYENQSARLTDPKLNEFLEKHGSSIDEQDEMGRTVLLRAMQDGRDKVAAHLMKLGADTTLTDKRNQTAHDLMLKARGSMTMEMPSPGLPARLAAIPPAQFNPEQNLRADPLTLSFMETLFLYDDDGRTRAERWNWVTRERHTVRLPLPATTSKKKQARYLTLNTEDGLWILGLLSVLVTREGEVRDLTAMQLDEHGDYAVTPLSLPTTKGDPLVVALNDNSLLVLGLGKPGDNTLYSYRLFLRDRDKGRVEFRELASPPELKYGAMATQLKDGRVLVTGETFQNNRQAWLFDPSSESWRMTGEMNSKRAHPAIAVLPDGRVFVAGNNGRVYWRAHSAISAELWNPLSGTWSPLPDLPLSFGVNAYRAQGPSATVLPDGSLVVAGGMHNQVLILRSWGGSFASQWTLGGSIPRQRVGARLQTLDDNKVAVLGGWGLTPNKRCCRSRSGGDVLELGSNGESYRQSVGLQHREAAITHGNGRSFVAGGWAKYSMSSETVQASSFAELINHDGRQVKPMTQLPRPLLYGRALWIDDDRILVKSVSFDKRIRSDLRHINSRSLESEYAGYLAVYRISTGRWEVIDDRHIAGAELAGLIDSEAILVGPGLGTWAVDVDQFSIREMPERVAVRGAKVSAVSRDGRIIVAGGQAQTDFFQAADIDCLVKNCPLRWYSEGELGPADRYEIWDPLSGKWHFSAKKQVPAEGAVIRQDGRVFTLGWSDGEMMIEASSADGTRWQVLSKPGEGPLCGQPDSGDSSCRLVLGNLPAGQGDRVFLVVRQPGWSGDSQYSLWLFSDQQRRWMSVARDLTEQQLNESSTLPGQQGGSSLKGAFFNTDQARLWWE